VSDDGRAQQPHVIVVGAGFGGLAAVQAFNRKPVRVTLIDRTNHHLFQPLLYQVATAGLNPAEIAAPIRSVVARQKNVTPLLGRVTKIDFAARTIEINDGEKTLSYDYLILAAGGRTSYFGHAEWERWAPGLKSLADARRIRERVLLAFERAEKAEDPALRQKLMTMVVVGGGPTGVEMAGALAELASRTLVRDFRNIDPQQARIILIEATPRVLGTFPEELSDYARKRLEKMGVTVQVNTKVLDLGDGWIKTDHERIDTFNVVWAAGVGGSELAPQLGVPTDRAGRIMVDADLRISGQERVYCIGDAAHFEHPHTWGGKPLPGVSPVAIQQGGWAVHNILRQMAAQQTEPFNYHDLGSMATIGRSAAIAVIGKIKMSGFIAWLAWLFVHLMKLVGHDNRMLVLIQWAWSYVMWKRGARLITDVAQPASLAASEPVPLEQHGPTSEPAKKEPETREPETKTGAPSS
jgi:NADH dehydrogenase